MTDKPGRPATSPVLEQIRQFRDERRHREALALALDALAGELARLRDSLLIALENLPARQHLPAAMVIPDAEPHPLLSWLMEPKSRILH